MAKLAEWLPRLWYRRGFSLALLPLLPLLPFSWLFAALAGLRRLAFRRGWLSRERLPVPVVVVGNLVAGGAGKTPLTLWLVAELKARGRHPGIVSRGYGAAGDVQLVSASGDAAHCGDEPLLLARRSGVPVAVGRDRAAAGRALLAAHPECDVLVADDGLQHYRLGRDAEIAVFDARGAGNGMLLPAGPLREPLTRLAAVDAVVLNGLSALAGLPPQLPVFAMTLAGTRFVSLADPARQCGAGDLAGRTLHAYAGIGDPARFFRHLEGLGLRVVAHPFPDHHCYVAADFAPARGGVVLLTEKDAVKCAGLIDGEAWLLPVCAEVAPALVDRILEKIDGRTTA